LSGLLQHFDTLRAAVASGDHKRATQAATELASRAAEDFPTLHATLHLLGYHGELGLVNEVVATAWPQVQEAASYSRTAVAAYASRATDHLIYEYLEEATAPRADDSGLLAALERYFAVDVARLETYLALLSGKAGRPWRTGDFADLSAAALSGLLVEFTGMAHRAGVSYGKAHLVREQLPRYFLDRHAGYLYPREDVAALLRHGRQPPPVARGEAPHPLVPDRLTLRNFLEKMVQTVEPEFYPAAAIVELLPLWLGFLELRDLISTALHDEATVDLAGLAVEMAPAWHDAQDPLLARNLLGDQ
jgi:hypothetical protein